MTSNFSPGELAASARRYSNEVILCLEAQPGLYAFFNNAREFLGTSESPSVAPWLPYGQELEARTRREQRAPRSAAASLDEILKGVL